METPLKTEKKKLEFDIAQRIYDFEIVHPDIRVFSLDIKHNEITDVWEVIASISTRL